MLANFCFIFGNGTIGTGRNLTAYDDRADSAIAGIATSTASALTRGGRTAIARRNATEPTLATDRATGLAANIATADRGATAHRAADRRAAGSDTTQSDTTIGIPGKCGATIAGSTSIRFSLGNRNRTSGTEIANSGTSASLHRAIGDPAKYRTGCATGATRGSTETGCSSRRTTGAPRRSDRYRLTGICIDRTTLAG